ncbi:glycosyltransferase, group 2 family protein [Gleimia coleocanis DSM 15436]|uniref:Glucosyl-3-phosphoglycerate synthase n=1 Tax=Gleimia coleocanis DSM 15436 TaxID=525245 RepID=C0VY57_9ACTO|nr:glycosyltransferase family 2 protein [Gleimia coleocanis]EEH64360.1 glycosyltransferase, group 2 family protein [Gleimia coleocanis DSM 15436]
METSTQRRQNKTAVVIPAHNEARSIANTVRACRALPGVDLLIVVDDGSDDNTQEYARQAGAVVVRHSVSRGKASAMETGVKVAAMRDIEGGLPRNILFLDADLGDTAVEATALVETLQSGVADCVIATLPQQRGAGGRGFVMNLARKAIFKTTGWKPQAPLSGQRCLTREALDKAMPFAEGWGVEVGMTIDLLQNGFTIQEVPCDFTHRATGNDLVGNLHRADQYKDVWVAAMRRRLKRSRVSAEAIKRASADQAPGKPYSLAE